MNDISTKDLITPEELYLDLLKKCLTRRLFGENYSVLQSGRGLFQRSMRKVLRTLLASRNVDLVRHIPFDSDLRVVGHVPPEAETMLSLRFLDNLQSCITDVISHNVPGDLIETGVWRGGAAIFMRAVLKAYRETTRIVWVADSFQGLPIPNPERYPADAGDLHWTYKELAVPLNTVKANFVRYGLLDEQVRFLIGWFKDTLPVAPIERLAILRLDGDMYESTMDSLQYLYPKLSVGGYVIIDDFGYTVACRGAVQDFRAKWGIAEDLQYVDSVGVFWQRLRMNK